MSKGTALVTGASSGIGAATVRALVADGWAVHMTARRADRLEALARETGATAHVIDIRDHAAMAALVEAVPFDLLVANAGKGAAMGALEEATPEEIAELVGINVTALIQLVAAITPGMTARGRGHVVTLGSVAGLYATGASLYGASKHAVRGFMRNMRIDRHGKGIRFTDIQPGRVDTEFYDVAVKDPAKRDAAKASGIEDLTPEDIAEAIRWAAALPPRVNIAAIEVTPTDQVFGGYRFAGR